MKMTPLLPEKAGGTSRWDLLQVWAALNWMSKNDKAAFSKAAQAVGLSDKDLQESVKYLGYEVSLWNNIAPQRGPEPEETDEDEELSH